MCVVKLRFTTSLGKKNLGKFGGFNKFAWRNPRDSTVINEIATGASWIEAASENRKLYREIRLPDFLAHKYRQADEFTALLKYMMMARKDEERRAPNTAYSNL